MSYVIASCLLLLIATTVIHYEVLRLLTVGLPLLHMRHPRMQLIFVIIGAFGAHLGQIRNGAWSRACSVPGPRPTHKRERGEPRGSP